MSSTKSILLVGVGGQGTILASRVLTKGLVAAGYDVKMSEIHGMSQRGGSVSTQIRFGEKVYSPIIGRGTADAIVAFEQMEGLRYIDFLKVDGMMVINDYRQPSLPVMIGDAEYPDGIIDELSSKVKTVVFDAADVANSIGNLKVQNIVLLGALIKVIGLENLEWEAIISLEVPPKFKDMNIEAYHKGLELAS
ncbi:indolepyruvate oxidoreductase subunit beta [Calorimonas adulescens]|uniref:Indolepyruvate oxidoreductase subunit beta n=1 Tax=Calorimonas adulescens TaxID=2606906 RepID=A0A5D8Q9Y7_9THEO|nr:indolepyruvate oxidoreductase subunit beta [Calorimonas adulescens]TZE81332.1 indolepyruvate oxidoreductase subunit beta [Calorimonas adulescens]